MNRHVNAIAGRLSLRPPQRRSLEMLDRITEIAPPRKGTDAAALEAALEAIRTTWSRGALLLCPAFCGKGEYPNLTVKKIPKQVLSRCEWGHDDYSLRMENLPKKPPEPGQQALDP